MHSEDKLTADQRLRLEALNQAVAASAVMETRYPSVIVERAAVFEKYLRDGKEVKEAK